MPEKDPMWNFWFPSGGETGAAIITAVVVRVNWPTLALTAWPMTPTRRDRLVKHQAIYLSNRTF